MPLIETTDKLDAALAPLAAADFVTVDTEFLRETTYWPKLCLIQIAARLPAGEVAYIIDPLAPGINLAPFYALMANEAVTKVFHAARQDIEIFYTNTGRTPSPVFDTQIAAMVCGFGEAISYANLVKSLTNEDVDKSVRETDWSRRALTPAQMAYALGDVTHLVVVYSLLRKELEATGRADWLAEEMAMLVNPNTYEQLPENAWQRYRRKVKSRKSLGVLMALAEWREASAQRQNVPRGRVLRDEILIDLAVHAPTTATKMSDLRSVNEGFVRSERGREALDIIRGGLKRDPSTLPPLDDFRPLPAEASASLELLRVLLRAEAARCRVASRLIATTEDLERLAVEPAPDIPALQGWRREIFGEKALLLKSGRLALSLNEQGGVVASPVAAA